MDLNKQLCWWLGSIFVATILLIAGVIAHDRLSDKCSIDHLFDFHLDAEHIKELAGEDKIKKSIESFQERKAEERRQKWANEVREWGNNARSAFDSDKGTFSEPDRDCNRDR